MTANGNNDMSCARVQTYSAGKIGAAERHNERKNNDYGNGNVDPERIPLNVHFKDPGDRSYMDILREMEVAGEVSRKGLRADAVLFDEVIFDVNTMYFEQRGGYEYAIEFYSEAYRYACEKFGEQNIISAVMHADEINKAATEKLGRPVYHYHMHLMAIPVVEKEVRWSKRCKSPELVGTVKEVIHQISHSKKWASRDPVLDEQGNPVFRKNGKPKYRPSYSVLQDEFFQHMTEHGFEGFTRGKEGSTAEHLSSLDYQIQQDKARLAEIEKKIQAAVVQYEPMETTIQTYRAIDSAGKKSHLTGNYSVSKKDFEELTALAKEGLGSRGRIRSLEDTIKDYQNRLYQMSTSVWNLQEKYEKLLETCRPFLIALEHFPELVRKFVDQVKQLFKEKESAKARDARARGYSERQQWDR